MTKALILFKKWRRNLGRLRLSVQAEEEQGQAGDASEKGQSLAYRLCSAVHRRFSRLIEHPSVVESRAYYEASDPEENAKTTPPPDEYVDLRCIWVIEFYTPAHAESLLSAFQKLGWDRDDSGGRRDPVVWLQRLRERPYGGGWFNFGHIRKPSSSHRFGFHGRIAPLPPNIEYATGELYSLTSSLTCIVMGFIFEEEDSSLFDQALRVDRMTYMEPLRRGHRIVRPKQQKADHINQIRADARRIAGTWFSQHLPGLFASGILDGEFPTCEFVTLRKSQPFPDRPDGSDRPPPYFSALDIDFDIDSWFWPEMPGLKFTWPIKRERENRYHSILAIGETEFEEEKLKSWGGNNRSSQITYVDHMIKGLLSRWAILPMLAGYAKHINAIRDSATLRPKTGHDPLKILRSIGQHVSYNVDIAAVTAELIPYANERVLFEHEIETFKPCNQGRHQDEELTIARGLAFQINEQATWLQKTDQSLRDHLTQYGSMLGATENIRVQRKLGTFTIVIVILTVIMVWDDVRNSQFLADFCEWFSHLILR